MKNKCTLSRVEKHVIKKSDKHFGTIFDFCKMSKNLYNHANYLIRNEFVSNGKWLRYNDLDKILKNDLEFPDYRNMPTAQSAQQTLRLLDKNWKSFFAEIKDYSKNKQKYLGKPKMPKYKKSTFILIMTNQNCKLNNDIVVFPRCFNSFNIKTKIIDNSNFVSLQQVRFLPHRDKIVAEIVYTIRIPKKLDDNNRYIGIDIGVNNLATVSNNFGAESFIINGRPLKSINQKFNKLTSHYKEVCKRMNNRYSSNRINRLFNKRNEKIDDYMHKASRKIIDFCKYNDIHTIIIGKNKDWKQGCKMSKKNNQNFVQIPFARLIDMIQYKAENIGIAVILTEESYTSGTSFIDNEEPVREYYNKSRRLHRGLFKSNDGILINADLNGAYQIIKKVVPIKWDRGCALHPFVVNIA